jgi:hypothetical protein
LVQRWLSKRPADRPASAGMAAVELRALIHATASSEPTAHRDVTLGGVYDAETLGAAEQNAAESQPQALHSSAALPLDNATSGHRARSEDQPRETEVRSTLGWGTSASDFTGTQTMRPDATERGAVSGSTPRTRPSAAHSTGDRTRRKNHAFTREPWASQSAMWTGSLARPQTPAPVSSSPWPHVSWWDRLTPVQKNVVTVLGAAVGSFTIAWLGVHTYSTIQSDLAAQSSSPAQSDTSPSSHSVAQGDSSPRAGLPSAPPFNAPQFNAPPPAASAQAVTVAQPQASAPSKTAVPRAAGPSTSSPKTGAMQKATTPRAPTKPAASKQLPGSGLW